MLFRILSSAIILPGFVWLMFLDPPVYFRAFLAMSFFVGFGEYRSLMHQKGLTLNPWPGLLGLFILIMPEVLKGLAPTALVAPEGLFAPLQALAAFFIFTALWSVSNADIEKGVTRFFAELGGPLYIGVLGRHILLLHQLKYGPWWVLLVFWFAWIYDAGALFVGKPFGKRKFSELSPNKTWEGFFGGIAFSAILSAFVIPLFLPKDFPLGPWALALVSVPASVLAQAGDLFESMLKRFAGVKDSSSVIVSHGGFLDKMDSSLFVAPFLYMVALWLGLK
jgi:phosphatidate cytidylyltransferase